MFETDQYFSRLHFVCFSVSDPDGGFDGAIQHLTCDPDGGFDADIKHLTCSTVEDDEQHFFPKP